MKNIRTTLACVISLLPIIAHADVITFEDAPTWSNTSSVSAFSSGGFNFKLDGSGATLTNQQLCGPACPVNGTNLALLPYGPSLLAMSKSDGGAFDLIGFQGAGSFNFNLFNGSHPEYIPDQIDVTGTLVGGGSVMQSFLINKTTGSNGALSFSDYVFNSNFTNLISASFSSSGKSPTPFGFGFTVDNIVVTAVPEPETCAMLLAGLALMAGVSRRRKQAAA
jgi:hypothetical protein